MDDWLLSDNEFISYGLSHAVAAVAFVVGAWAVVRVGRSHRGTATAERFSRAFAVTIVAVMVPLSLGDLLLRGYNIHVHLPIQLCDLAWMVSAYALWTRRRLAVAVTYFWGLSLTSQALLTPSLDVGFPHVGFLVFWVGHLLIIWAAIYLTWGLGHAPDWPRYRGAVLLTAVWAVSIFAVNGLLDTNYGFLNAKPTDASALDLLGPWPWYVLWEVVIVLVAWALMTWPWVRRRRPAVTTRTA